MWRVLLRVKMGEGGSDEMKERHVPMNTGYSIMRNDREVYYGPFRDWIKTKWPVDAPPLGTSGSSIHRWWGCEISFKPYHDDCFNVKNIKRGAQRFIS